MYCKGVISKNELVGKSLIKNSKSEQAYKDVFTASVI